MWVYLSHARFMKGSPKLPGVSGVSNLCILCNVISILINDVQEICVKMLGGLFLSSIIETVKLDA